MLKLLFLVVLEMQHIENNNLIMNIYYLTIDYDKYWHQLVFGYAIYKIGQGLIHWQRLFSI